MGRYMPNAETTQTTTRIYKVTDYSSVLGTFDKLADARARMKAEGEGRLCSITAITTTKIKINSEEVIQYLR